MPPKRLERAKHKQRRKEKLTLAEHAAVALSERPRGRSEAEHERIVRRVFGV
jgi:hypothetical protein